MTITKHIATAPNSRIEFTSAEALTLFLSEHGEYSDGGTVTEDITEGEAMQPREVAAWRVKYILNLQNLTPLIEALINSLPDPPKALIRSAWDNATIIDRWSPTVTFIQEQLQWTDSQVNEIFTAAESLPI